MSSERVMTKYSHWHARAQARERHMDPVRRRWLGAESRTGMSGWTKAKLGLAAVALAGGGKLAYDGRRWYKRNMRNGPFKWAQEQWRNRRDAMTKKQFEESKHIVNVQYYKEKTITPESFEIGFTTTFGELTDQAVGAFGDNTIYLARKEENGRWLAVKDDYSKRRHIGPELWKTNEFTMRAFPDNVKVLSIVACATVYGTRMTFQRDYDVENWNDIRFRFGSQRGNPDAALDDPVEVLPVVEGKFILHRQLKPEEFIGEVDRLHLSLTMSVDRPCSSLTTASQRQQWTADKLLLDRQIQPLKDTIEQLKKKTETGAVL